MYYNKIILLLTYAITLRVGGEKRIVFGKKKHAFELCAVCTLICYIVHNIIVFVLYNV